MDIKKKDCKMKNLKMSTWAIPIILNLLTIIGLIGALMYEGSTDYFFVWLILICILSISLVKKT